VGVLRAGRGMMRVAAKVASIQRVLGRGGFPSREK
jgi:hypothetical protein